MVGTVPELTLGVPCPGRSCFCPGTVRDCTCPYWCNNEIAVLHVL